MRRAKHILLWLACLTVLTTGSVKAAEPALTVKARLIWGTDDPNPNKPDIKPVDPKLAATLGKVLRWKNYYDCGGTNVTLNLNQVKKVRVSADCELEINNLGQSRAEIKMYGKGKLVLTQKQEILVEPLVLGGPDKNDSAWFVVLSKPKP